MPGSYGCLGCGTGAGRSVPLPSCRGVWSDWPRSTGGSPSQSGALVVALRPIRMVVALLGVGALAGPATVGVAGAAGPAVASGAIIRASGSQSTNWSGYGESGSFSSVGGSWTVPAAAATPGATTYASTWIGIDGLANRNLIQTGTESDVIGGVAHYDAWWEVLPAAERVVKRLPVHPGDRMTALIGRGASGKWTISLADTTTGLSFTLTRGYRGPAASAEWIQERPQVGRTLATLTPYGSTTFTGLTADGAAPGLVPGHALAMVDAVGGPVISAPSPLSPSGTSFAVAYGSAAPAAPADCTTRAAATRRDPVGPGRAGRARYAASSCRTPTPGAERMEPPTWARTAFLSLPKGLRSAVLHQKGSYVPWETGRPPEAPPCPPGMTTGPPDFIGLGAPKCGTSWWFSLILAHPDVHSPVKKELLFFNNLFFDRYRQGGVSDGDLRSYGDWFPRPDGATTGSGPRPISSGTSCPASSTGGAGGEALVMLRDPIERYHSDISRRMPRRILHYVRYRSLARGFYSAELSPGRTWSIRRGSSAAVRGVHRRSGHPPGRHLPVPRIYDSFRPPRLLAKVNQTKAKRELDPGLRRLLSELYEPDVVRLATRYPQIDLGRWPHFAHLRPAAG